MKKFYILVVIFGATMMACEKNEPDAVVSQQPIPLPLKEEAVFVQNEHNLAMRDFALAVGNAMNKNVEFRKMIKREALTMFDGDYDVLVQHIIDKPIQASHDEAMQLRSGNITVRNLLEDSYSLSVNANNHSGITTRNSINSIIDELLAQNPDLQITIPVHAEDWDENNTMPLIAFVPKEAGKGTPYIPGYDIANDFAFVPVDGLNAPDEAVIVISQNERIIRRDPSLPWQPIIVLHPIDFIPMDSVDLEIELPGFPDTPLQIDETVPSAPTNLTAQSTAVGVGLSWTEPPQSDICHVYGYYIYRKGPADADFILRHVNNGYYNTGYYDQTTEAGLTYYYSVTAYNSAGQSVRSNVVTAIGTGRPASVETFDAILNSNSEVELRWTTNNNQYIDAVHLYKKEWLWPLPTSSDYSLYQTFNANQYDFFDYYTPLDFPLGRFFKRQICYKMQIATPTGYSNPKYDFVRIPERSVTQPSPVRIKSITCNSNVESWFRGAPEFCIKVLNVNSQDKTKAYEVQPEIYIQFSGSIFGWAKTQYFNVLVLNWKMDEWYDVLSFYVIEDDSNDRDDFTLSAKVNFKLDFLDGTLGEGSTAELNVNFSHKGETIGNGYLNYFDGIGKVIEFPNYGFKMTVGE